MANRIRVIIDSGIVLQASLHPAGPAGQCLHLLDNEAVEGFISGRVREEYADVLSRPAIRAKNPFLTNEQALAVLEWLDERMTLVTLPTRVIEYSRDSKDEPVINLALDVGADYIVSRDKDLLDLPQSRDFQLLFPFVRIVNPVTFVLEIRKALGDATSTR